MEQQLFYAEDPEEMAALVQSIMQVQMARAIDQGKTDADAIAETMMVHVRRLLCPR